MANAGEKIAVAVVTATKGEVFAKDADGQMHRLNVGDTLYKGEVVITGPGSTAELASTEGVTIPIAEQQTVSVDGEVTGAVAQDTTTSAIAPLAGTEAQTVIQALNSGQDLNQILEDTAAGLTAGAGSEGGSSFVQLLRVAEGVTPVGYDFGLNPEG